MKGVAVQIGLRKTSEYYYLTQPNWKSQIHQQPEQFILPDEIYKDIDSWRYIGIDRDATSISLMIEKYGYNAEWVCAQIKNDDRTLAPIWDPISVPAEKRSHAWSLNVASIDLADLFRELKLKCIHTLMVDVDGAETPIFERYDWSIIPLHIQIELHPFGTKPNNHRYITRLFQSLNYEKVREHKFENDDCQAHFVYRGWFLDWSRSESDRLSKRGRRRKK